MHSTIRRGSTTVEINSQQVVYSISFARDGKHVLSGGKEGMLQRWRVEDGQELGEPIRTEGAEIYAAAMSPDRKWLVCGSRRVAGNTTLCQVWDAQTQKKVLDIQGHTHTVFSVDISPDSTKFATGGGDKRAFVFSITTGEILVGPLKHGWALVAVRFSPNGDRLATATRNEVDTTSIRIYDSDNGQQLLNIPCWFWNYISSPLAWSVDGRRLYAASYRKIKCFNPSSGTLLNKWSIPGSRRAYSILLACNQKFAIIVTTMSLLFWDTSTHQQIGTVIELASEIKSVALSPDDDYVVTGEANGKIAFRSLRDILPSSYLGVDVNLPLICVSNPAFESWKQGDLTRVEELLNEDINRVYPSNPVHRARALAYRALVRIRSGLWEDAVDDAHKSIKIQRSVIGYVAHAIALVELEEHDSAMEVFDLAFSDNFPGENNLLLLIKAIILFERGQRDNAIRRVDRLIDIMAGDKSPYITVKAQMFLLLGIISMRRGDNKHAIKLFMRAKKAIPVQQDPYLVVISLIFGWDFDRFAVEVQSHMFEAMYTMVDTLGEEVLSSETTAGWDSKIIQMCVTAFESSGDKATRSKDHRRAIAQYSAALSLNPLTPMGILVKRSTARAILGLWKGALKDADEAVKVDPSSPWGYERRYAALHSLRRYDEALGAFIRMLSLIEDSVDHELVKKCIAPPRLETVINNVVHGVFGISPLVLIDTKSGRLCDGPERLHIFKSEPQCKELIFSMMEELDNRRIQNVVEEYFQYVTLSHVWQGREPLFQDVERAGSVWKLDSSPLNGKLRKFCEVVRSDGYRWAWSDTCCIDKTISTVLNQSLKMMYRWYEASTATFVLLDDVAPSSAFGGLKGSKWMTRAWTSQELLAPKVIRFYACDWKPYLGDTRPNHKESPEVVQELADALRIARENIIAFNPDDLTVREKLRLASTRTATVEEDVAYSLIGIFKSDIRPDYGEKEAALGHLLEEIVARSGEVTVLSWTGRCSSYNSCLPATLAVYNQPSGSPASISDTEMDMCIAALRKSLSQTDAILINNRVTRLPPARFANRRLHLPCIIFTVRKLGMQNSAGGSENHYRAKTTSIGDVEFRTSDRLPLTEPRKLVFVHPWIRDLCDPHDGFTWASTTGDDDSDPETEPGFTPTSPLHPQPTAPMDNYTRALRLIVRLQQPFHALLLQQQPHGEFKRVAAEHKIVVPGIDRLENFARDVHMGVVEIL